ncbi:MAG TPA: Xaa-Pro peptidase family protein [Candidatus Dormibacteraeota bacterium]|nr:Xaa-Pro peptidase family protein [Candidatus Dormibacteraeota bacterium]
MSDRRVRTDLGQFAHGQFRVDYEDRPDPAHLREKRVARAREAMKAAGVDALLVWKDENVRYLTGLRAQIIAGKSALLNGCLITLEQGPILLASGGEVQRIGVLMPWIEEVHAVPIMEAAGLVQAAVSKTIAPLMRKLGVDAGVVGLDEAAYCQVEALAAALPGARLRDGDAVMQAARRIKFPEEIALMQEACAIAEGLTQAAVEAIKPGVRETDVVAEAMHALFRLGGEMSHVTTPFVASGERMAPPQRSASDKIIRDGDVVFIDIGAMWSGYFGDMGRTVICGKPSRRQQEVYTAVHEALQAATATMAAGRTNDDVAAAVREVAASHDLADHFISLFIGHGVGMGSNEPPYIGEALPGADTVVLEEGMTFAVEPLIWVPGVRGGAGVRLEDTILVTADGGRPLSRMGWDDRLML